MTKAAELAKMGEVLTNSQIGGRRNIVINGAMQVAQRATSVTGLGDGDEGYVVQDRWRHTVAAGAGRYTATQTAITDLPGFANCFKMACTTADTSIAATERFMFVQRIEGQDLQQLKKGTSDAEKVTVSFYVKGHDSATYVCALYDVDNDRFVGATFPVTTSWARQTITFPADTTGALGDDTTNDLELRFILHAGSNFTSGTLATAWESATAANFAVGINSIFESTSATFFLTGVQLEVGSQATPFEHRSFGEELMLCQRYYQVVDALMWGHQAKIGDTNRHVNWVLQPTMRATPALTVSQVRSGFSFGGTNELADDMANFYLSAGDTTNHVYAENQVCDAEL